MCFSVWPSTSPSGVGRSRSSADETSQHLKRELNNLQILMIVISTIIGVGFAVNSATILAFAGPGMALLAFGLVGLVACLVMEGISEMVTTWQVPNPMVQFTRYFVDKDLAHVVGFAYWYTFAISHAAVITLAGVLVQYWTNDNTPRILLFVFVPLISALINVRSVKVFANIELFGGSIKLLGVVAMFISMIVFDLGGGSKPPIYSDCIRVGITYKEEVAPNKKIAAMIALSIAVFPYIGVESVTMTAYEARSLDALRFPAKNIAIITTTTYVLSILGFVLNVNWNSPYLPAYFEQWATWDSPELQFDCTNLKNRDFTIDPNTARDNNHRIPNSNHTLPVIAAQQAGAPIYAAIVNSFLLYSAISCASSTLFVASRTLYGIGLAAAAESEPRVLEKLISKFAKVSKSTGVPETAVYFSSLCFIWLPFLSLGTSEAAHDIQQLATSLGSTSCLLVWASQCLAFIRYYDWLNIHRQRLQGSFAVYDRWGKTTFSSYLSHWQPLIAWLGMLFSLIIVLGFAAAGFCIDKSTAFKALEIYLGPAICLIMFCILKIIRRKTTDDHSWYVHLGDWAELEQVLGTLKSMERRDRQPSNESNDVEL